MIRSKSELKFFIQADLMLRTGSFKRSIKQRIIDVLAPDYVFQYIKVSRKCSYYSHKEGRRVPVLANFYKYRRQRLGMKLGFSISFDEIGYGVVIPHHGTIVIGSGNQIGNYAVFHTSTCITAGKKIIGDGFYLATGAKVVKDIEVGNYVSVGANSVVNTNVPDNCMVAGMPARTIKESEAWYHRDGAEYTRRVRECERLKEKYQL